MRRIVGNVLSGPWYVRLPAYLVLCLALVWPLALAEGDFAAPIVIGLVSGSVVRGLDDQELRTLTGWDRRRRQRELRRAREGILPAEQVDRERLVAVLTRRERDDRVAAWIVLAAGPVTAVLVWLRHDRLAGVLLPVGIVWLPAAFSVLSLALRRQVRERRESVSRLRTAGSEAA